MKKFILTAVAVTSLGLAGCQNMDGSGMTWNKQTVGTGVGALAGGLAGSQLGKGSGQLWATGAGVLLGALAGGSIGQSLDKADMMYAQRASDQAHSARIGDEIRWNNPESGNYGTITPVRDGYSNSGRYCREYQQTITVGGRRETGFGQACQTANGDWEIVS